MMTRAELDHDHDNADARADKEPGGPIPAFMRRAAPPPGGPWGSTAIAPPDPPAPRRLLSSMTSAERKEYPLFKGCFNYFPDALAYVAHVSWRGNEKHNPGQPLHWARGKSADHADCEMRHMMESDQFDPEGLLHMGAKAWRALAELQEFLEMKYCLDLPRGATPPGIELTTDPVTAR